MDPTREQILEMTETIARACGWKPVNNGMFIELENTEDFMGNLAVFDPFESWDDAFKAADAPPVGRVHIDPELAESDIEYFVGFGWGSGIGDEEYGYWAIHSDKRTAFFLTLHEAAKAKLEGYQQEDGN